MKKILVISSLIIVLAGLGFLVLRNRPAVNDAGSLPSTTNTESTNGAAETKPSSKITNKQAVEIPIDALWIYTSFFQKTDKLYLDLQRSGEVLSKKNLQGKTELRFGNLTQDVVNEAFKISDTRGVLNAKDSGEGEPLFSQSEWIKVGMVINGKLKFSQSAPIEDFPSDFQQLLKELKQFVKKQPIAQNIKAFLVAEIVDSQRAQSIKSDPRKFFDFISVSEQELNAAPAIKNAVGAFGRQIPVRDTSELQKIEEYIKLSNLKSVSKEFFITVANDSFQLQLLLIQ